MKMVFTNLHSTVVLLKHHIAFHKSFAVLHLHSTVVLLKRTL